jgi:hypothetical protein
MTPKEKAIELVTNMSFSKSKVADYVTGEMVDVPGNIYAKQCALIAVDEILKAYPHTFDKELEYTSSGDEIIVIKNTRCNNEFWYNVKQEIEKL